MQRWSQGQHLWLAQAQSQHLTRFPVSENVEWKLWRQSRIIMNWCAAGSGIGCKDKINSRLKSISMHACIWHLILQFYTVLFCPTNISDLPLLNRDGCCATESEKLRLPNHCALVEPKRGTEEMMLHLKAACWQHRHSRTKSRHARPKTSRLTISTQPSTKNLNNFLCFTTKPLGKKQAIAPFSIGDVGADISG